MKTREILMAAAVMLFLSACADKVQVDKACAVTVKRETAVNNHVNKPEFENKAMSLSYRKSGGMATFNDVLYTQDTLSIIGQKVIGKSVTTMAIPISTATTTNTLNYDQNTQVIDAESETVTQYTNGTSTLTRYTFNGTCK